MQGVASGCAAAGVSVLVINLDRSTDRLAHMRAELARAGMAFERVAAIDGANLPDRLKPYFCNAGGEVGSPLKPAEIGCYASHMTVWQRLVEMDLPAAMVCEDDIELCSGIAGLLDAVMCCVPPRWDVVRLVDYDRVGYNKALTVAALPDSRSLIRYWQLPMGAGAYLISRSGAAKLLMPSIRIRGVDADLRRPWLFGLNEYGVHPPPVEQPPTMPSLIGADRGCGDASRQLPPTLRKWRKSLLKLRQHAYTIEMIGWGPWLRLAMRR